MLANLRTNRYRLRGRVAYIDVSTPTHRNVRTVIDRRYLRHVIDGRGRWAAHFNRGNLYVCRRVFGARGKTESMHVKIAGRIPGKLVDHHDTDTLNNRRSNLRHGTKAQNRQNSRSRVGHSSRFKGVTKLGKGRFRAYIRKDLKLIDLGRFEDEKKAAQAYDSAAILHFGEFARPNFPYAKTGT